MLLDKDKAQTKYIKRMLSDVGGQTGLEPRDRKYLMFVV